ASACACADGCRGTPRCSMCSRKCEMPHWASGSKRGPLRTCTAIATRSLWGSGAISATSPEGRTTRVGSRAVSLGARFGRLAPEGRIDLEVVSGFAAQVRDVARERVHALEVPERFQHLGLVLRVLVRSGELLEL